MALAATTLVACGPPPPPPTAHLYIESDGDYLTFKPNSLTVKAGTHIVLTFRHSGTIISQRHDWVLAKGGALKALLDQIGRVAATMPEDAGSVLRPDDPRVIAATKPVDKGESAAIEFTAPAPGDYPFFCSTPGHGDSMNGILHVTVQ